MSFIKNAAKEARRLPKVVWVAAVILPFGLTFVGAWIAGKTIYDKRKKNHKIKR